MAQAQDTPGNPCLGWIKVVAMGMSTLAMRTFHWSTLSTVAEVKNSAKVLWLIGMVLSEMDCWESYDKSPRKKLRPHAGHRTQTSRARKAPEGKPTLWLQWPVY
jgi:hypothetical protein